MKKRTLLIVLAVAIAVIVSALFTAEHYTSQPSFCGSCHIMKKYYDSWKTSKHGEEDVSCVACHYPPGSKTALKSKFKGLGQLFTYLGTDVRTVRTPARVSDLSCSTEDCHPTDRYANKKVQFTEKVSYVHTTHLYKKIEGQLLHCDTCHQHVRAEKHFEVPRVACYLCHFKNAKFNEGRAKCSSCHEIPAKSLQKQSVDGTASEGKAITHETLKMADVPCRSCHYQIVQGNGEIKKEDCFNCHEYSEEMIKKSEDKNAMHSEHVGAQNAACFDCHTPIEHRNVEFMDIVRLKCQGCHPDHHRYQAMLLLGEERNGVPWTPALMQDVRTSCIGCHIKEIEIKGEKTLAGSAKTCAACHTPKHEQMVEEWIKKTNEEMAFAQELEKEALEVLAAAKGRVSEELYEKAMILFREGQENVKIVQRGGGVHNKKYSVMLLDGAMNNFEDLVDLLNK